MAEGLYLTLLDFYRNRLSKWVDEKELWAQVHQAFVGEAKTLLRETAQTEPPFDPMAGLRCRGVRGIRFIVDLQEEARLNPTDDGFSLWLRGDPSVSTSIELESKTAPPRLRTTLAHELGHTFFFDTSVFPPRPFISHLSLSESRHASNEEWWCMDFARAYLVPEFWLMRELRRPALPSLRAALGLKIKLGVSWNLLFRRLIWDVKVWQNCVFFMTDRSNFRVVGLWKSPEFKDWKFSKWYELRGKSIISRDCSESPERREHSQETFIPQLKQFRLSSLAFPRSNSLLCSLCPGEDSSLDRFASSINTTAH